MSSIDESTVEDAALEWFGELGYAIGHEPRLPQSSTLATLRDPAVAGLPKLLSGELSVAEATCKQDLQVQPGVMKP
jgi:hypothetical protein